MQSDSHDGWPLFMAARSTYQRSVKAYYALKLIGDDPDAPHMARAREAILAAGGAERCNVFTRISAGAVRPGAVARGAGDAGRDHAAAALVSVPSRQGVLLVAHGDRAAAGADGAAAAGAQPARRRRSRSCSSTPPERERRLHHQSDRLSCGARSSWRRPAAARGRAVSFPRRTPPAGDRKAASPSSPSG